MRQQSSMFLARKLANLAVPELTKVACTPLDGCWAPIRTHLNRVSKMQYPYATSLYNPNPNAAIFTQKPPHL